MIDTKFLFVIIIFFLKIKTIYRNIKKYSITEG